MQDPLITSVYPSTKMPYYIGTLPYTRFSAGVKALHLLCHNLNLRGQSAYLLPINGVSASEQETFCEPGFLTPILTARIARYHLEHGHTPITVYPEIVVGNPFGGACVVRYVLNFPGVLGGNKIFDKNELCFGYSKILAETTNNPDNILFIPTSDTRIFHPAAEQSERKGTCFYASKYQKNHCGKLLDITKNSYEITSGFSDSQSPEEIADIFRKSEIFYTYENTALATEATLCGCPAVFIPNEHLESIIASEELGSDGIAWGNSDQEITRAKNTVDKAIHNYTKNIFRFYEMLDIFIEKTQQHAKNIKHLPENLEALLGHLPKTEDVSWKNIHYAPLLKKLPWRLEKHIGAALVTLGLEKDGVFLWNRAINRAKGINNE